MLVRIQESNFGLFSFGLQLCVGVSSLRSLERDRKEIRAEGSVEDRVSPASIVRRRFVDHVPSITLADIMLHDI